MSDDKCPTYLGVLFRGAEDREDLLKGGPKEHPGLKGVFDRVPGPAHGALWQSVSTGFTEQVTKALDVPIFDRLLDVATGYRELHGYADPQRYPPDKNVHKSYTLWKGKARTKPTISVTIDGKPVPELTIELEAILEVEIKAATLLIRAGRIWSVTTGEVSARGVLNVQGRELHKSDDVRMFKGITITSKEGVPIP